MKGILQTRIEETMHALKWPSPVVNSWFTELQMGTVSFNGGSFDVWGGVRDDYSAGDPSNGGGIGHGLGMVTTAVTNLNTER